MPVLARMTKSNIRVNRELRLWIFLFLVSVAIAVAISFVLEKVNQPLSLAGEPGSHWEINIREMVRALFRELFLWFVGVFLLLAALRLIFLTVPPSTRGDSNLKRNGMSQDE